ncbi:lipid phosphate phosphatase, putative [Entamoeba histolytica KU27]|uniref:Lipid phosphate phosphatase, putative n=2 Tax=Entamoeba histolytica TaxID=5759 RepID=M2Q006_ENTHI|nr:lipid phosphate phosphatase, putative [Entamoeba histolytica KU27]
MWKEQWITFLKKRKIDIIITFIVFVLSKLFGLLPPFKMETPHNHPSYHYSKHENTFTRNMTITIDFFIPLICIILLCLKNHYISGLFNSILSFIFNDSLNGTITQLYKIFAGRPRPFYFNGCNPSLYTCTKSFPSGHSSFSMAGLLFLSLFLYFYFKKSNIHLNSLSSVFFCGLPSFLAIIIAVTRTRDHYHHFSDILGGSILGGFVAIISFFSTYQRFYTEEEDETVDYEIINNKTVLLEEE